MGFGLSMVSRAGEALVADNWVAAVDRCKDADAVEAPSAKVRCFIGVRPSGETLEGVATLCESAGCEAREVIRWHPPEKWHVTLCFLGEQDVALLPFIESVIVEACRQVRGFRLQPGGLNLWPSPRRARVVSLKISGDVDVLLSLQRELAAGLKNYLPEEDRHFTPHLTLGYVRRGGILGLDLRQRLQKLAEAPFPPWTVTAVDLMKGGGEYRELARVPLASAAG